MKLTSYEISKKLKEIGFEAETMSYWDIESRECQVWYKVPFEEEFIPAYDLEKILDALPKYMLCVNDGENYRLSIFPSEGFLGYYKLGKVQEHLFLINDESLADTAARLLVKLIEDKIITINK